MRLIDADAICSGCPSYKDCHGECWSDGECEIYDVLIKSPTIEAKPVKRGRWKFHKDGSGTCDQCRFTQKHIYDDDGWQNYCGVCGADMRERRNNNA